MSERLRTELLDALPRLSRYAAKLTRDPLRAADLTQQTVLKALTHLGRFEDQGYGLTPWLYAICRNENKTFYRSVAHEVEDPDDAHALRQSIPPSQLLHLEFVEVGEAIDRLPFEQRRALLDVCAGGAEYQEVAAARHVRREP